jgi:hypothetical protein
MRGGGRRLGANEQSKLTSSLYLGPIQSPHRGKIPPSFSGRQAFDRAVRFWSSRREPLRSAELGCALLMLFFSAGCGGATVPCPTPTAELDSLRGQSEQLDQDLTRAESEARRLEKGRDQARSRVEAAQAALDSIARARRR